MNDQPTPDQKPCNHVGFTHMFFELAPDKQGRTDENGSPLWLMEITKLMCKKCAAVFHFRGVQPGFSMEAPGVGIDGTSITLPLGIGPKKFEVETEVVQQGLPPQDEFVTK